ncbi:MAG: bifunctional adenosylcobinamide kinase/adenosylcobinamide-phosphate guanylyltransferase [Dorea sp.]|nr:bifunctional adenosylcobinamide kinase/adenosylcobinamide-phosphate guanylyltransferase [Dorea sp.]
MLHLITGGSGSGKSSYAEEQMLYISGQTRNQEEKDPCVYLATMKPYGKEALMKIERHRKLRASKGFVTVECYKELDRIRLPKNSGILLECMSNLGANELYGEDGTLKNRHKTAKKILKGIGHILKQTENLVIVTNEVSSEDKDYSEEILEYIYLLGEVNQELACMADKVTEVVYGIPVPVKG